MVYLVQEYLLYFSCMFYYLKWFSLLTLQIVLLFVCLFFTRNFSLISNAIYAVTSFKSAGSSFFGCLFSKCCLYVFGSGICDCNDNNNNNNEKWYHIDRMTLHGKNLHIWMKIDHLLCKRHNWSPMPFVLLSFDPVHCVRIVSSFWQLFLVPLLVIGSFDDHEPFLPLKWSQKIKNYKEFDKLAIDVDANIYIDANQQFKCIEF